MAMTVDEITRQIREAMAASEYPDEFLKQIQDELERIPGARVSMHSIDARRMEREGLMAEVDDEPHGAPSQAREDQQKSLVDMARRMEKPAMDIHVMNDVKGLSLESRNAGDTAFAAREKTPHQRKPRERKDLSKRDIVSESPFRSITITHLEDPSQKIAFCESRSEKRIFARAMEVFSDFGDDDLMRAVANAGYDKIEAPGIVQMPEGAYDDAFSDALSEAPSTESGSRIRTFLDARIAPRLMPLLEGAGTEDPIGKLSALAPRPVDLALYAAAGNAPARLEALRTHPLSFREMSRDPDVMANIDSRKAPDYAIRSSLDLNDKAYAKFRLIERAVSNEISRSDTSVFSDYAEALEVRNNALFGVRIVQRNNIPSNGEDVMRMVEAMGRVRDLIYSDTIDAADAEKILGRYSRTSWKRALDEIDATYSDRMMPDETGVTPGAMP